MTLLEIKDKYQALHMQYYEELIKVIESGCNKLIIMLNSLKGKYPFPLIEEEYGFRSDNCWAINLRYISRIGIRYCGQFINMIIISKNDKGNASERIRLTFASYEDDCDFKNVCYPDDMYFGEAADCRYKEMTIQYDWNNFWNLLNSLKPFFENAGTPNMYELMLCEISEESVLLRDKENQIDELCEDLESYINDVFSRRKEYVTKNRKHFILLPNNLSIRYKGKFHNCIIEDDYSISLGYIQQNQYIAEECYNQDPYTVNDDFARYIPGEYKLSHEVSLNPYHNGFSQFGYALNDLIFICGDDMEKLNSSKYIRQQSVDYPKSILTE